MTLQEWFDSEKRDYGMGMALLGKYCKNRILIQNLSRKQNPRKLEHELKKALKRTVAKNTNEAAMKIITPEKIENEVMDKPNPSKGTSRAYSADFSKLIVVRENRKVNFEDLPPKIQKMWEQNRDAYKEIRATHEKLKLMVNATPEDRQPLTSRIVELDTLVRKNWDVIDAWKPGDETETPEAPEEAAQIDHKRIVANRKYISTNTKKLAAETNEAKAEKLRAKVQARVDELKAAGEEMKPETIAELNKVGIKC